MLLQNLLTKMKWIGPGLLFIVGLGLGFWLGHRNPTVITKEKQIEVHDKMDQKEKESYVAQIESLHQQITVLQNRETSLKKKTIIKPDGTVIETVDKNTKTNTQATAQKDSQKDYTAKTKEKEIQIVHDVVYKEVEKTQKDYSWFVGGQIGVAINDPKTLLTEVFLSRHIWGPFWLGAQADPKNLKNIAITANIMFGF